MASMNIDPKYGSPDADVKMFLEHFDEKPGGKVLEVGANEEYVSNILADNGYKVVGIDLRSYMGSIPCNYIRIENDFCSARVCGFDCVVSLSAIEHFGLGTYGDKPNPYLDAIAMHEIWQALRDGGTCYLTVPYGSQHVDYDIHWRVYNRKSLQERIIQRFKVEKRMYFTSASCAIRGQQREGFLPVTEEEADMYDGSTFPHVTVFLKMRREG